MYVKFIGAISTYSYFAGCALGYSCYKIDALWTTDHLITDLTNGLCENYCKHAAASYAYYGTSVSFLCFRLNRNSTFVVIAPNFCILDCKRTSIDLHICKKKKKKVVGTQI